MRLTHVLLAQNIGKHFRGKWRTMKHRTVFNDGNVDNLMASGIKIQNALDVISEKSVEIPSEYIDPLPLNKLPRDETHPLWNPEVCHTFGDSNVLVYGMKQAEVLTKTLVINELPDNIQKSIEAVKISPETDVQLKNSILQAHLFDAHQEKLVRDKHPEKKMWVYALKYGITDQRKNKLITDKLLQYCEKLSDDATVSQRKILYDTVLAVPFEKEGNQFQFELTANAFVVAKQPIAPHQGQPKFTSDSLPNIYPLESHISIEKENIYRLRNVYPISKQGLFEHPHTIYVHYTPIDVHNYTLEPVNEDQVHSRALIKAFTTAAAKAQSEYGPNVRDLPKSITVQCVHVYLNKFHFGVYQLNTLNLDGLDGIKNYWFNTPPISLYTNCEYQESRPKLMNYNQDVLRHALAFHQNQ